MHECACSHSSSGYESGINRIEATAKHSFDLLFCLFVYFLGRLFFFFFLGFSLYSLLLCCVCFVSLLFLLLLLKKKRCTCCCFYVITFTSFFCSLEMSVSTTFLFVFVFLFKYQLTFTIFVLPSHALFSVDSISSPLTCFSAYFFFPPSFASVLFFYVCVHWLPVTL